MKKELMSVHGLLDDELNEELKEICLKEGRDLGLSDRFFRIPLHVSLKRSFYADDEQIKDDIEKFLEGKMIHCGGFELFKVRDMLWLKVNDCPELYEIHERLDCMLKDRYDIPIDEFDRRYCPHISLFSGCSQEKLDGIYDRLNGKITGRSFIIDSCYVGTEKDRR